MSNTEISGSVVFGPFEQTHVSVYMMTLKLMEASYVQALVEDPSKLDILCSYLLSDPHLEKDLPN